MGRAILTCKVCGKKYEACKTPNPTGAFRWRDVACSRECGLTYLSAIEKSREPEHTESSTTNN